MRTVTAGINPLSTTETSSEFLANPVTDGVFLEHVEVDSALNVNDEDLCRFEKVVSVEGMCNKSELGGMDSAINGIDEGLRNFGEATSEENLCTKPISRETLSDSNELPSKSCATNITARVSSSLENRRVLPVWTRKTREHVSATPAKWQRLSGQKRTIEGIEEENGLSIKRVQTSHGPHPSPLIASDPNTSTNLHCEEWWEGNQASSKKRVRSELGRIGTNI
nr:hypothetical protein CFP56_22973 [Quercus suber]